MRSLRTLRAPVTSCLATTLLALAACGREAPPPPPQEQPVPLALDMDVLARAILDHLALQPGERVLLAAQPGRFDPLVGSVRAGVRAAGATDLGAWSVEGAAPPEWGTDLTFRVGDRPVTKQDGDASGARAAGGRNLIDREVELPAGAIRVAPLEETVQGRVVFPPSVWNRQRVEGLTLGFVDGVATQVTASAGLEAALAEMDVAGPAGRSFREFALGFNPLLSIPEADPWIPYYGYGAGVVRLSLGYNTELGGAVGGGYVRWNFFTDATVTVDGVTWVDGGRLTPSSPHVP